MYSPSECTSGIILEPKILGQAKLIHSLLSGIFENHMWVGGHLSKFVT